jgi:hypothetical protein
MRASMCAMPLLRNKNAQRPDALYRANTPRICWASGHLPVPSSS